MELVGLCCLFFMIIMGIVSIIAVWIGARSEAATAILCCTMAACITIVSSQAVKYGRTDRTYKIIKYTAYNNTDYGRLEVLKCAYNKARVIDNCKAVFRWEGDINKLLSVLPLEPVKDKE